MTDDVLTQTTCPLSQLATDAELFAKAVADANEKGWLLHGLVQLSADTKLSPWACGFKKKGENGYSFSPTGRGDTMAQAAANAFGLLPVGLPEGIRLVVPSEEAPAKAALSMEEMLS